MLYKLFKHYMLRLCNEYEEAFNVAQQGPRRNEIMRPDVYFLQQFLRGKL